MARPVRTLLAVLAALALVAAGCGGDDDDNANGGDAVEEPSGGSDGDSDSGSDGDSGSNDCAPTSVTGATPSNDGFSGSNAVAVNLAEGKAFTVYLSDFEIGTDELSMFSNPEVPAGGTMFMLAITAFNADPADLDPVAVGDTFEYTPDFEVMTIRVTAYDDTGTAFGVNNEAEGTVTITGVGDTLCGTVTYADEEKSLSGTFAAAVADM